MKEKISVKAFTVGELLQDPTQLEKYKNPYHLVPNGGSEMRDWIEHCASNPFSETNDTALILALRKDEVVGRLGLYAAPIHYSSHDDRSFWMDGFFLEAEARKSGVGGFMMMVAAEKHPSLVACGSPSENARRLYEAVGVKEIVQFQRYVYFFHPEPIVDWVVKPTILKGPAKVAASAGLKLLHWVTRQRKEPAVHFKRVTHFSPSIDAISVPEGCNYFPKPAALLNWTLKISKADAFEAHKNGQLVGYCILDKHHLDPSPPHFLPAMDVGTVRDVYLEGDELEGYDDFLSFMIQYFSDKSVSLFEWNVSEPKLSSLCRSRGMFKKGGLRVLVKPPSDAKDNSPWVLTPGTADLLLHG